MKHHVQDIPGSIVIALSRVQASIDAVPKSQKNNHGGYMFAGVDDIYAAIARKMGEAGLAMISLEDEAQITRLEQNGKTVQWLKATFSFVLATKDATWTDERCRRTIAVQITGAQTFQSAQSYAEKTFLRSLFKLPTGDLDLDALAQADTLEDQVELNAGGQRKRKSSYRAKKDGDDKIFNEIRAAIDTASSPDMLQHIRTAYVEEWNNAPERWSELLDGDYETKMMALKQDELF